MVRPIVPLVSTNLLHSFAMGHAQLQSDWDPNGLLRPNRLTPSFFEDWAVHVRSSVPRRAGKNVLPDIQR